MIDFVVKRDLSVYDSFGVHSWKQTIHTLLFYVTQV